jgi:hypothetical protein
MDWAPTDAAKPEDTSKPDYQRCDMSLEAMSDDWDERFNAMLGEG